MKRTSLFAILTSVALLVGVGACVAIPLVPDAYELMMPMRDGVRLYTCGTAPRGKKQCPVIVVRTPYGASPRSAWRTCADTSACSSIAAAAD